MFPNRTNQPKKRYDANKLPVTKLSAETLARVESALTAAGKYLKMRYGHYQCGSIHQKDSEGESKSSLKKCTSGRSAAKLRIPKRTVSKRSNTNRSISRTTISSRHRPKSWVAPVKASTANTSSSINNFIKKRRERRRLSKAMRLLELLDNKDASDDAGISDDSLKNMMKLRKLLPDNNCGICDECWANY